MNLKAELVSSVQHANLPKLLADQSETLPVRARVTPKTYSQVLISDWEDHPVNHIALFLLKQTTNHM